MTHLRLVLLATTALTAMQFASSASHAQTASIVVAQAREELGPDGKPKAPAKGSADSRAPAAPAPHPARLHRHLTLPRPRLLRIRHRPQRRRLMPRRRPRPRQRHIRRRLLLTACGTSGSAGGAPAA